MEKEYNISEIFELEEGTKFITQNESHPSKCKIIRGSLHVWFKQEKDTRGRWLLCELTKVWVNSKFRIIKRL